MYISARWRFIVCSGVGLWLDFLYLTYLAPKPQIPGDARCRLVVRYVDKPPMMFLL